jgi:putative iron-regulated protein
LKTARDGPEPLLNAWPLDESWIEPVSDSSNPGIVGSEKEFPSLSPQLIAELNQRDGEKNVACGWHAVEFLLWGQDRSADGPGNHPWTDFSTAPHARRRSQYLLGCAEILVLYLDDLVRQWAPGRKTVFGLITAAEDVAIHAKHLASALGCRIPDVPPEDIEG